MMTTMMMIEAEDFRLSVLSVFHLRYNYPSFSSPPLLPLFFNLHTHCPSCIAARQWPDRAAGYVYY